MPEPEPVQPVASEPDAIQVRVIRGLTSETVSFPVEEQ